jgi:hypothetical protein
VYAHGDERAFTGICSPTRRTDQAEEDLTALRRRARSGGVSPPSNQHTAVAAGPAARRR